MGILARMKLEGKFWFSYLCCVYSELVVLKVRSIQVRLLLSVDVISESFFINSSQEIGDITNFFIDSSMSTLHSIIFLDQVHMNQ